jgi:methionyl-tRNA synthetase
MPKSQKDAHTRTHAKVNCPDCGSPFTPEDLTSHRSRCELKPKPCEYCSLELPIFELIDHQEACANRTELCEMCHKYIKLKDMIDHLSENCFQQLEAVPPVKRKRTKSPLQDRKRIKRS